MMASKRKNFHYHYAEKFDVKSRKQTKLFLPKKTVIFAVLVLSIFGIVTTTFSAYISENEVTEDRPHSILVDVRNAKLKQDIALIGAHADLAGTGWGVQANKKVYFINTKAWTNVYMHFWGNDWSNYEKMDRVADTGIYYKSFGSDYTSNGFNFDSDKSDPAGSSDFYDWVTASKAYDTTTAFDDMRALNGTASVTAMISFDGGNTFTGTNSSSNYASISGYNLSSGSTSTTVSSGNTKNANAQGVCYPAYASSYTVSATSGTNVTFLGFSTTKTTSGSPTITNSDTSFTKQSLQYNSSSADGDTWYAYYVMPYVTDASISPSDIAASSVKPTITYSGSGQYAWANITAPNISGYTFSNWTFSTGTQTYSAGSSTSRTITVRTDANCSATANYTINAPTAASISNKTYTIGDDAVSLNPSVTIAASGATAVNTYTIKDSSNNTVSSSVASVDSSGNFTASVPGVYTVTLSAKAKKGSLVSATARTATATVTVKPAKPEWSLTMTGFEPDEDLENGHEYGFDPLNPYVVTLGSNFSFNASIKNPPDDSNYVYTWYNADDEVLGSVTSTGSSDTTKISFGSDTASEASSANVTVPAYCKVTYTGTDSTTIYATGDTITVYYYIKSLIKDFKIDNLQKIYNTPNDSKMKIEYNLLSGNGYTTTLYASSDNVNFYEAVSAAGFLGTEIGSTAVYQLDPSAQMYLNGPKYFYLNMGKSGANAKSDVVHTTVGANKAEGTRAIYFINNAGLDLTSYRVMAFYIDGEGDLRYQTAQDVFKGVSGKDNTRFRVMIPSDATKISFGIARKNRYALPDLNDTELDYTKGNTESGKDNIYFVAYTYNSTADSAMITLDDSKNTVVANSKTLVSGYTDTGDEPNPFYQLSFNYTSYQSAD